MRSYTKSRIKKALEQTGRSLTLDDVEAIVELDAIAGKIEGAVEQYKGVKDYFQIGSRYFMRPSYARIFAIERIQRRLYGVFADIGTLWALDLERTPSELDTVPGHMQLLRYAKQIDVPVTQVNTIIKENLPQDDGDDDDDSFDHWKLCAILAREVGGSVDEWYHASPEKIAGACKAVDEKIEAELKALGGKVSGPPQVTDKLIAVKEFSDKLRALEASWQV